MILFFCLFFFPAKYLPPYNCQTLVCINFFLIQKPNISATIEFHKLFYEKQKNNKKSKSQDSCITCFSYIKYPTSENVLWFYEKSDLRKHKTDKNKNDNM